MNKSNLKDYYYDYIHWCIKMYIFQIRNKNYPLDHWKNQLKETLIKRNLICYRLQNKSVQLKLNLS